jgi:hypothetical protein
MPERRRGGEEGKRRDKNVICSFFYVGGKITLKCMYTK